MAADGMTQISVRLHEGVLRALTAEAARRGFEVADFAQMVLQEHIAPALEDRDLAERLVAEAEIKEAAARLAREFSPANAFDPHVTLKVFQCIRERPNLLRAYLKAIGGGTGYERGNHRKARLNRAIGSTVRTAVGASSTANTGNVMSVTVSGELCFSYTVLHPASFPPSGPGCAGIR